jgi:hypothetical protein
MVDPSQFSRVGLNCHAEIWDEKSSLALAALRYYMTPKNGPRDFI